MDHLPVSVRRNLILLRELDQRCADNMKLLDDMQENVMEDITSLSREERAAKKRDLEAMFKVIGGFSDDKVELANQTYDMIDKQIQKLDAEYARFKTNLMKEYANMPSESQPSRSGKKNKRRRKKNQGNSCNSSKAAGIMPQLARPDISALAALPETLLNTNPLLDMPIDPNEPRFCTCRQVSYGQMIGCDNNECSIEWFHFTCVGLVEKPKGKWFCAECRKK